MPLYHQRAFKGAKNKLEGQFQGAWQYSRGSERRFREEEARWLWGMDGGQLAQTQQSQTSKATPTHSSIDTPRAAEQSTKEGKRKALHTQPTMTQRVTNKTATST